MVSDFSIALAKFDVFVGTLSYRTAIRAVGEGSPEPRMVLYIPDGVYDSALYEGVIPRTFHGYPVTVEPERNALNLLMAMWKYTEEKS